MAQLLVQVVSVTSLAAGATTTVAHNLESNGVAVAPTLVIADRDTPIKVVSVSTTGVTFQNSGLTTASATFRCERGWQPEVDAFTVTPFLYGGGGGSSAPGVVSKVFALTTPAVNFAAATSTEQKFTAGQVTLPANTFGAGSTIRFRMAGNLNKAGGTATIQIRFYGQDGLTTLLADTGLLNYANNTNIVLDVTATVRASGATAATVGSVLGGHATSLVLQQTPNGVNLDTTIANALTMTVDFDAADANSDIDINEFEVYVAR
jgi:hypothetical protein